MYKTDKEKAYKIIESLSPPLILLNGPWAIGKNTFCKNFSEYSIYTYDSPEKLQKYLQNRKDKKIDHTPLIIKSEIKEPETIDKLFQGEFHNFSYIFMYPNKGENYQEQILNKIKNGTPNDSELKILTDKYQQNQDIKIVKKITAKLMKEWQPIYQLHIEHFQDKIFTILI